MMRRAPSPAAVGLSALFFLVYYAVFSAAAWAGDDFAVRYRCYFAWETAIPLLPWTALIYISVNFMVIPMLFTFPTVAQLKPLLATIAVELAVATLCFFIFPLQDGYRDGPAQSALLRLAQGMALQHNYFPSLHVALAFTAAFCLSQHHGKVMSLCFYVWASLVAVSTLTVHEHHLIDVAGGIALAWLAYRGVYLRLLKPLQDMNY